MYIAKRFLIDSLLGLLAASVLLAQTTVITDVTVINPRKGGVQSHRNVIIERGRIRSIAAASSPTPKGARLVDGKQKFLIPGLWDAHVHLTKTGVLSLPLFVANGVTGVRDMGSDLSEVAEWRAQINAGKLIGPRIKTSGRILESRANVERMKREGTVEPVDRIRLGVGSPDEARTAVKRLAAEGVDHIKMRSTPDLDTFRAVAEEAKRHNLPFTAHPVASPEELLRAGLRSVEHFLTYPPLNALTELQRRTLFRKMAEAGMYLSNTMVNLDGLLSIPYAEGKKIVEDTTGKLDARRKYLCGYLIQDWREQVEEGKDAPYDPLRKELPNVYRDYREMREEGVQFLAGTDAGVLFIYPGFSLHDELDKLVRDVGFTPMVALRVATDGIPAFYREVNSLGAVEPGQAADLVLLNADPVVDIRNTRRIAGVSVRGNWLDRTELDRLLRQAEQSAQGGCRSMIGQ
jgi:hypothetical protein